MRDALSGSGGTSDTFEYHRKWGWLVNMFLLSSNRENGTIEHLPMPGSMVDQPTHLMHIYCMLQGMYINHLNDQVKRMAKHG